jgi:hypothetical protein
VRAWEKQPGETAASWRAFGLFRDLGPGRTLRAVAELLYGSGYQEGSRRVPGRLKEWSSKHDWVARAESWDAHLDMIRAGAVEDHEKAKSGEEAARRASLRDANLKNEERAAELGKLALDQFERLLKELPLVRQTVVKEDDAGRPVLYDIAPSVRDHSLVIRRLHQVSTSSRPTKVAATDPTGENQAQGLSLAALQGVILDALAPYPDIRVEVARRLAELGGEEEG